MVVNMDRVGLYVIFPLHDAEWSVRHRETVLRWASSEVFFLYYPTGRSGFVQTHAHLKVKAKLLTVFYTVSYYWSFPYTVPAC